jgi:hypothetical protein
MQSPGQNLGAEPLTLAGFAEGRGDSGVKAKPEKQL